ncbi:MAG: helix-turn-helix domain-containing protein [Clostridia bacterium]|nr:helix-turn-helix domain-containing protein [Clostridia bacterium]
MEIGNVLARLRRERGISQETLAGMLFVSKDLVSKWETGARRPDYAMIERIAGIYGIPADNILERDRYIVAELSGCLPDGTDLSESNLSERMNRFLRSIRRDDAELFVRRYYLLESVSALADRIGIRENHVRSRLSKIRKKLIRFLLEGK